MRQVIAAFFLKVNIMKDKMMFYGITLARRFNNVNKNTSFMTLHNKVNHICNLVIGDLKHANTIVAASYDTGSKVILPTY